MNIAAHPCASPACITAMQYMPRSSYSPKSTSSFQSQKPSTDISLSGVQDSWILLLSPPHFSSSPPRRLFWLFWCLEVFSGNTSRSDVGVPDTLLLLPLLSSHSSFTLRLSLNQDNSSLQRGERERERARVSESERGGFLWWQYWWRMWVKRLYPQSSQDTPYETRQPPQTNNMKHGRTYKDGGRSRDSFSVIYSMTLKQWTVNLSLTCAGNHNVRLIFHQKEIVIFARQYF